MRRALAYLVHLRLPFELVLAPIFLWGALLSGGAWDGGTTAAFLALHLFLYPAATAFNAAHDRDRGPVSGLERPPAPPPGLVPFSILWAAAGAPLALAAGALFAAVFAAAAFWSFAYSHPRTRWKAHPGRSAAAIALGQGALGFAAGWVAAGGGGGSVEALALGGAGAALAALGLYPVTQAFQVEEDRARGDRTLAVALGPARALRLGALALAAAGALTALLVARRFGPPDAFLIALGFTGLALAVERLARALPRLDRPATYARAMRILRAGTFAFLLFIALEAIGSG